MRGFRLYRSAAALLLAASAFALTFPAHGAPSGTLVFGTPTPGHAPDCLCRAPNGIARVGQSICLGGRVAECVMVLNNTSWKFTDAACPVSMLSTPIPMR
jgi:hypothetical protein